MANVKNEMKYIVSACLAGVECRYDCRSNARKEIESLIEIGLAIPVCPEQLGGLSTPRPPAERLNDKVITINGQDVTTHYLNGAQQALKIGQLFGATKALLKSKSPMCGFGRIYDGTFKKNLIPGNGVFAEELAKQGIEVVEID